VLMIVVFSILKPATFATHDNAATIAQSQMVLVIVALGSLIPLITGEFDLSVGYLACTSALVEAVLVGKHDVNAAVATLVAIGVALLVGVVNAVLGGLDLYLTGGKTLFANIPEFLTKVGSGYWHGFPLDLVVALVFALICLYVLRMTPLGRSMYATGAGRDASRLAGVPTSAVRAGALVSSAFVAGCAGLLELGLVGSASVTIGPDFLLPALAACFLGTTVHPHGRFNVAGTIVAIFLIAVGVTGLEQLGVPAWVEPVFDGGALIAAVVLTLTARRIRARRFA
jgi:ribose transport system permease protein